MSTVRCVLNRKQVHTVVAVAVGNCSAGTQQNATTITGASPPGSATCPSPEGDLGPLGAGIRGPTTEKLRVVVLALPAAAGAERRSPL